MKKIKKFLSLILALMIVISSVVISSSAEGAGITDFSVISSIAEKEVEVRWWKGDGKYFLFMPSDADLSDLTVKYSASGDVFLDGAALANGSETELNANVRYTLTCDGNSYSLYVLKSEGLPSLHITTESGSMDAVHADKNHKEPASIVISSDGEIVLEKELEYIKGRGNATWTYAKKPYNIKFDKKTSLFGMDKAKKWTLLANYMDETLMRNHVAFGLASQLGIPFTSEHIYVDLYINNEYYGNYVLCESVEIGDGRVEITDLTDATEEANPDIDIEECELGGAHETNYKKLAAGTQKWVNIPNNPEDISGGYLLEYELPDRYVNEISGFVTGRNQTIVVKEPEYASEAQVKYISSLYQQFEDALYSQTGYNTSGKHYSEYIDYESFVKMYVFQEFTKNLDAGMTSFYIYKDSGSDKFVAAPVWDFDMALGENFSRFGMNVADTDVWWAGVIHHWSENSIKTLPTVLNALYRHDDFFAAAVEKWETEFSKILTDEYIGELADFSQTVADSATMNAIRWSTYAVSGQDEVKQSYLKDVQTKLLSFISGRKAFLDEGLCDTSVRIFINANGGKGNMFNKYAIHTGQLFTAPDCTFTYSDMEFYCWNTEADGSGVSYYPGDSILLEETRLDLYAMWTEKAEEPETPDKPDENCGHLCHKTGFMSFIWKIINLFNKLFRINALCQCGEVHY